MTAIHHSPDETVMRCFCNQVGRCLSDCLTADYFRPTPGEVIGTWNLFRRDGSTSRDVPFDLLPVAIQDYLRGRLCAAR